MEEREFQKELRNIFEDLRGHTDMMILRVYWSIDENKNVVIDEENLKEEFEIKLREIKDILN